MRLYCALVHHPVKDRAGEVITTAVTNVDVHDIARSCRVYDVCRYYLVTPVTAQRIIVDRIREHWRHGAGARRVPERTEAIALVEPVPAIEDAVADITRREGRAPVLVATAASPPEGLSTVSFEALGAAIEAGEGPYLILFGTGHGLTEDLIRSCDRILPPVRGGGYNHLSVRAAVAIVLDRLLGERREPPPAR